MKCICCNRNVRTTRDERDAFNACGYYTPQWYVRDQGMDEDKLRRRGVDPEDMDNFLCFDCAGDISVEEDPDSNADEPITLRNGLKITPVKESNPRDDYNRRSREISRENNLTLAQGDFDDQMDANEFFMRGFYHWFADCHNWGCELGNDMYVVVEYATDSTMVKVEVVDCAGRKKNVIAAEYVRSLDYDKVINVCKEFEREFGDPNYMLLSDEG